MPKSYEREGFFGKYTEHYDDQGNKIGESREREGFFGKYVEHYDAHGNKIGESRDREGFFGAYTEHTDTSGRKTGESREREGFFGKYVEHTDSSGKKTGESRKREGFFGDYTEHEGTGFRGKEPEKDSGSSSSWCFITTACARARGLPDHCEQLVILRRFRDEYVSMLPNGRQLVQEYYRFAPVIVQNIEQQPDSDRIFEEIFLQVEQAVQEIKAGRQSDAIATYGRLFKGLKQRFASN